MCSTVSTSYEDDTDHTDETDETDETDRQTTNPRFPFLPERSACEWVRSSDESPECGTIAHRVQPHPSLGPRGLHVAVQPLGRRRRHPPRLVRDF
ncbi:hypothetical protein TCAL_14590 [Tigriopus californicus]|uniref:Uncharacterized protein n=1 Tax=Tigriopus californicus TaxID=6832 RepID=A0A553PD63_TIGCA|nr:hypothetical protein TCAL_14590 [Tigriopus californicus]